MGFSNLGVLFLAASLFGAPPDRLNVGGLGDLVTVISGDDRIGISALSPAGDVDGDGLSDVLLRFSIRPEAFDDHDQVLLLYGFGPPGGDLDPFSPDVRKTIFDVARTNPDTEESLRGATGLAGGRDVDGDGRPDCLVASSYEKVVNTTTVLLIFGGPLPERIDGNQVGADVRGSFIVDGEEGSKYLGKSVDLAEDINGDGLAEILISDRGDLTGGGRVIVIYGSPELPRIVDLAKVGGELPGFVYKANSGHLLYSVNSVGDVDGDGLAELALNLTEPTGTALSFILFGNRAFPATVRQSDPLAGRGLRVIEASSIQSAGDRNRDGRGELAFDFFNPAPFAPGRAYILQGRPRAQLPETLDAAEFLEKRLGTIVEEPYDFGGSGGNGTRAPGFALSRGRDLDGDGSPELALTVASRHVKAGPALVAYGGALFIVKSAKPLPEKILAADLTQGFGLQLDGIDPQADFGRNVFLLDDFDGDGTGDILVTSAFGMCEHPEIIIDYKVWLVSGKVLGSALEPRLERLHPDSGAIGGANPVLLLGAGFGDAPTVLFGETPAPSVEVLGSGVLVAQAPPATLPSRVRIRVQPQRGGVTEGLPYTYKSGRTIQADGNRSLEVRHLSSVIESGRGMVTGDFNGDRRPDLAVVDNRLEPEKQFELHIVFGTGSRNGGVDLDSLAPGTGVTIFVPPEAGYITDLAGGGDINGDGFDDLVLRAASSPPPSEEEWRVVFGRAAFPSEIALDSLPRVARLFSESGALRVGAAAIIPDMNGDDKDDLILSGREGELSILLLIKGRNDFPDGDFPLDRLAEQGLGARLEADIDLSKMAGPAGDFNGDRVHDVFFGGNGVVLEGALVIIYGNPFLFSGEPIRLSKGLLGDNGGVLMAGTTLLSGQLFSAAALGDMNGDGAEEIFLRQDDYGTCTLSPRAGGGVVADRGALLAAGVPGGGLIDSLYASKSIGAPDFVPGPPGSQEGVVVWVSNGVAGEGLGYGSAAACDLDGDGYKDLLLGAPGVSTFDPIAGSAYVARGSKEFYARPVIRFPNAEDYGMRIVPPGGVHGFGRFLSGSFDWDQDGTDDIAIGAVDGSALVVFGDRGELEFVRGDVDARGGLGLTDAVVVLNFLFIGGIRPLCLDAADANDDGGVNITDAIYILSYLFLGGPRPPPPFPEAGTDMTPDAIRCPR
jgi:hypothetical protein